MNKKPVLEQSFWVDRLYRAVHRHEAVYSCPRPVWSAIEDTHRRILNRHIKPADSVLDVGCGWGRLLDLLPEDWNASYLGIDFVPEFIKMARADWPVNKFIVGEFFDELPKLKAGSFDWAVLIAIKPMLQENVGGEYWTQLHREVIRVSKRVLYLRYAIEDEGIVEVEINSGKKQKERTSDQKR